MAILKMTIFNELKRRNVFKVASVYLVTAWIIIQVANAVLPVIAAPEWVAKVILLLLFIGFPIAVIFAWAFELTADGLKRTQEVEAADSILHETGRKMNYALGAALLLVLGFIAYDKAVPGVEIANPGQLTIAVLPFDDMSHDASQQYFGDGMAEEILNSLAKVKQLRVIARTSSFKFKDKNIDIPEIGRLLDARYVLEGSVRKSPTTLRITAQLIDSTTGYHLWSETYDKPISDIFTIQDQLTFEITKALKLNLLKENLESSAVGKTDNQEAYELFLRGRDLGFERTKASMLEAEKLLLNAIELAPEFILAKAQLYILYHLFPLYATDLTDRQKEKASLLFDEIITAEENFPEKNIAIILNIQRRQTLDADHANIIKAFLQRTAKTYPSHQYTQHLLGNFLHTIGEDEEAAVVLEKGLQLDPLNSISMTVLIDTYISAGHYLKVEKLLQQLKERRPDSPFLPYSAARFYYEVKKNPRQALLEVDRPSSRENPYYYGKMLALTALTDLPKAIDMLQDIAPDGYIKSVLPTLLTFAEKRGISTETKQKLNAYLTQLDPNTRSLIKALSQANLGNASPLKYEFAHNPLMKIAYKDIYLEEIGQWIGSAYWRRAIMAKSEGNPLFAQEIQNTLGAIWLKCSEVRIDYLCLYSRFITQDYPASDAIRDLRQASENMFNYDDIGQELFMRTEIAYAKLHDHPEWEALVTRIENEFNGAITP